MVLNAEARGGELVIEDKVHVRSPQQRAGMRPASAPLPRPPQAAADTHTQPKPAVRALPPHTCMPPPAAHVPPHMASTPAP